MKKILIKFFIFYIILFILISPKVRNYLGDKIKYMIRKPFIELMQDI